MNVISVPSRNGILIRLTDERWKHVVLMHPGLRDKQSHVLRTVEDPDFILRGGAGELLAVSKLSKGTYIVVIYKEVLDDGFIITAYETTDTTWLFKKEIIWSKRS